MMIYGIHQLHSPYSIEHFRRELGAHIGKSLIAIFWLIERKFNRVKKCFAGDILFKSENHMESLCEILIHNHVVKPAMNDQPFNQALFTAIKGEIKAQNAVFNDESSAAVSIQTAFGTNPIMTIIQEPSEIVPDFLNDRFEVFDEVLGEGSVSRAIHFILMPQY